MMSTEVHMNTDVFHFCVLLDAVTYIYLQLLNLSFGFDVNVATQILSALD